ncbi:iron ABC transporter substrate-binding protein [Geodermatophilus poikilotrophus]|uniref:Iron(III) transport system substrate-binding protein n=1 Tax=Geodermatophilus poikilotrophus TaxID=1333667 RepID=A0A1I0CWP2_9ACTN|nr:iron ABC transporter substrate-binding protein [Geodermatophilus poikilotrophus]SET23856.1 iron(III) transport system substrate-binding protein [Geodermatophilus poikilotrophus]
MLGGTRLGRSTAAALTALVAAGALAGCGGDDAEAAETLTVYSAQHESLVRTMLEGFTEETGIALEFRDANDAELANQIVQEGEASPADVFLTENSPSIDVLDREGLLAPLDPATLDQVGEQFRPSSGNWTGFAARSTVLVHNPAQLPADQLPASILDLANPEWQGRIGIAAGGADFQAIVAGVLALRGEEATRAWLEGLQRNANVYPSNSAVMVAADEGEIDAGVMYHYYFYRDRAENGLKSDDAELHFFRNSDPGAFLSISGAGVLASSDQPEQAQRLVAYLTSPPAQQRLAESTALEYAVGNDVPSAEALPPLAELQAPQVDPGSLDQQRVTELMQDVGLL